MTSSGPILIISPSTQDLQCGIAAFSKILYHYFEELSKEVILIGTQDSYLNSRVTTRSVISFPNGDKEVETFLKNIERKYKPVFIWINYSPLGFSKSYYDLYYLRLLAKHLSHTPVVIYFHEYWPGNFFFEHWKFKIIKGIMLMRFWQMLPFFRKATVLTNSDYGMRQLIRYGMQPVFAPVFSNIYSNPDVEIDDAHIELIMFGSSGFPFDEDALLELLNRPQPKIVHVVGKNNRQRVELLEQRINKEFLQIKYYHHLPEEEVAQLLKRSDYGLTNYYESLSTKSGAVAAYKAYGLPIIGVGVFVQRPEIKSHDQIFLRVQDINQLCKKSNNQVPSNQYNNQIFQPIHEALVRANLLQASCA